jgi:hypothetical protein
MRMRDKISAENGGEQKFGEPSTITTHSVTCHIMAGLKKPHGIVVIYINAYTHIDLIKRTFLPQQNPPPPRISPIIIRINPPSQTIILDSAPLLPIRVPAITNIDKYIEIAVTPVKVLGPLANFEYINRYDNLHGNGIDPTCWELLVRVLEEIAVQYGARLAQLVAE